jgi:hypothetical protein
MRVVGIVALGFLVCLPLVARAERATELYAPTQIGVARDFLERARAAATLRQYEQARTYAQAAQLDARIAWGMTDAAPLRAEAAAIAAAAEALAADPASAAPAAIGSRSGP